MMQKIEYGGFADCLKIGNGEIAVIAATDFGPRILSFAFDGGDNIFGWHPDAAVATPLGTWRPYGGHRLWIAPENMPDSYAPDNDAVAFEAVGELSVNLTGKADENSKTQKQMIVTLDKSGSGVSVDHRITNLGEAEIEVSAWALSIMQPGGEAIILNEPFVPYGAESLLPVRSMAVWSYTDFADERWRFGAGEIRLKVDAEKAAPQKIGVLNRQGVARYEWSDLSFSKQFDFIDGAVYPDMNSNTEIYTAGPFVEIESLSPLTKLKQGESVNYRERWQLERKPSAQA